MLLPYLTAGIPTIDDSVAIFEAMADAGADGFEVGIPYADPLMDGPVIMEAGSQALRSGVTVDVALEVVRAVVERTGLPILVMTYVNPVLRHGVDSFLAKVDDAGGSGVILADLPPDESRPFVEAANRLGLGMVQFAAPTTGQDRLERMAELDPVFVYGIAEIGVTGERSGSSSNLEALSQAVRSVTDAPLVFGVGISTAEQAGSSSSRRRRRDRGIGDRASCPGGSGSRCRPCGGRRPGEGTSQRGPSRLTLQIQEGHADTRVMDPSVPGVGLEPTRACAQRILSPPRLPFRHPGREWDDRVPSTRPPAMQARNGHREKNNTMTLSSQSATICYNSLDGAMQGYRDDRRSYPGAEGHQCS